MKGEIIQQGTIVKIVIKDTIQYCKDGYRMGGNIGCKENELLLYERIDLESFPSFNDFFGKTTLVNHGDHAVVLEHVGQPFKKIDTKTDWFDYDVYKIMIKNGDIRNIFKQNIISLGVQQQLKYQK